MTHKIVKNINRLFIRNFQYDLRNITNEISCVYFIHCDAKLQNFYKFIRKPSRYSDPVFSHTKLKSLMKTCKSVSEQIETFDSYVKLSEEDVFNRISVCNNVENILKSAFPDSSVHLIGSSINGLGIGGCDLDLTFQFNNNQYASVQTNTISNVDVTSGKISFSEVFSLTVKQQLLFLGKLLKESKIIDATTIIPGRCPILTFQYNGFSCDLSINNRSAFNGTNFMKMCVIMDSRVALLYRIITYWGKRMKLFGGPMRFKSYSIFLMIVYFLQTRNQPILPSVKDLFLRTEFLTNLENWSYDATQYMKKIPVTNNSESPETLLREFFFFYSSFDFSSVICAMNANLVNGRDFILANPMFELNTISIQDPLNSSWNVTTGVNWKYCKGFIRGLLSVCNMYHDSYNQTVSDKDWGLVSLFECPPTDNSLPTKESIEILIPLKQVVKSKNECTEMFSGAVEKIVKILEHSLLFQFQPLDPKTNQSYSKKYNENATIIKLKRSKQSEESSVEEVKNKNDLCYQALCMVTDTWFGRSNYISKNSNGDELNFLNTEREISKDILKNRKTEEGKNFQFIFECYRYYENDHPHLCLNIKSVDKSIFILKLGIFLKEYLLKYGYKFI